MKPDEINTWKDVWEMPLIYDGKNYVWADNHTMALTFEALNHSERTKCVAAINEIIDYKIQDLFNVGVHFYRGNELIFVVRGWGELIGIGGLNLTPEKADELQNQFIRHVFNCLN